jgi:TonB family protein
VAPIASGQQWERPSRRRRLRYALQMPLDVTVLRSGIPNTVPGRAINMGEGGVGAVLAGELSPGEAVGVEIRLPRTATPVQARALVRHCDKLCLGMEFVGLSAEQQSKIRDWTVQAEAESEPDPGVKGRPENVPPRPTKAGAGDSRVARQFPTAERSSYLWILVPVFAAFLLAGGWWRWNRGWDAIEAALPRSGSSVTPRAHVPAEVMERLVIHRVDPDYPAAARSSNLQGVIVLDVVIGRDGSVVETRALNGPKILAQAAESTLRWWRFEPYRIDGRPAVVETTVAVEFKP